MTHEDLLGDIRQLPLDEKLLLLEALTRLVRAEALRDRPVNRDDTVPPFAKLRGVLSSGASLPDDYDWRDDYTDHLTKKCA